MNHRAYLEVLFSVAAFWAPTGLQAATEREAAEACVQAMALELGVEQNLPMDYWLSDDAGYPVPAKRQKSSFYVYAVHPETLKIVARANCVVDSDGVVKNLKPLYLKPADIRRLSQRR